MWKSDQEVVTRKFTYCLLDVLTGSGGFIVAMYMLMQPFVAVISGLNYELEVLSLLFVGKETRPIIKGSDIAFGKKYSEVRLSTMQLARLIVDLYNPVNKILDACKSKAPTVEVELA